MCGQQGLQNLCHASGFWHYLPDVNMRCWMLDVHFAVSFQKGLLLPTGWTQVLKKELLMLAGCGGHD